MEEKRIEEQLYVKPETAIVLLETEAGVLASSGVGGSTEQLEEDTFHW